LTIRALIVDDEPLARRSIRRFLDRDTGVALIGECADGASAVTAIRGNKPDVVFLDVQMPEMTGFDVIREIGPEVMPVTIFVTAYDRYALRAFDENATDYLLKPFRKERFDRALQRAKERVAGTLNLNDLRAVIACLDGDPAHPKYLDRLTVAENGRILLISVTDIDWVAASGNYAHLHTIRRTYEIRQTLAELEAKLNPNEFLRIHRSTIVNVRRIKEIQPWFHGHHLVILQSGQELRMSRYQRGVAEKLGIL
jgi:two-component system, LytTR family, response regulator